MKKTLCLFFAFFLLFLCGCRNTVVVVSSEKLDVGSIYADPALSGELKLVRYGWSGTGIGTKTVDGPAAGSVLSQLEQMEETGETAPKIADGTLSEYKAYYLPVEWGTMWIETENDLYRVAPDFSQICRVESHFGQGRILKVTDSFRKELSGVEQYWPRDSYFGTYKEGMLTVEHVYAAETTVRLNVRDMQVKNTYDENYRIVNKITLEVTSSQDQMVEVLLTCQQSDDNLGLGDCKRLEMKANKPQSVELLFSGWKDTPYWIYINAGNTALSVNIYPYRA